MRHVASYVWKIRRARHRRLNLSNPVPKVLPVHLPSTRRSIGAITLKTRTLSPAARLFIDCAHEVAEVIPGRSQWPIPRRTAEYLRWVNATHCQVFKG
jgi:hypothetical protein